MAKKNEKTTANNKKAKPRGKPWPKGVSGNPGGRPREGESWAGIITAIGNMSGPELSKWWDTSRKELAKLPKNVTLKELVVIQAYMRLFNDFSATVWDKMMERTEGKMTQPILHEWREEARKLGVDPDQLVEQFFASVDSRVSVGGSSETEEGTGGPAEAE